MHEVPQLIAAFAVGALLAAIFLWGLWRTVRGLERARRPALRVLASLVSRFGLVLTAFYLLIRHGDWQQALAAGCGFLLVRLLVAQRTSAWRIRQEAGS